MKAIHPHALRVAATAGLLLFPAAFTVFSQTRELTTDEVTRSADVVAVAKVQALKSEWTADRSKIVTRVTLAVDQYIKGDAQGQSLTVIVPGGEIDGVGELYSHMATFRQDENVVVFASRNKQGTYRVAAGSQGKFTIDRDKATGEQTVGRTRTLKEFTAAVRKAVENQAK